MTSTASRRQRLVRGRLALFVASGGVAIVLGLVSSGVAGATHGPPHTCEGQAITSASLNATNGDDFILGTTVKDVIAAGRGQDRVFTGSGNDYICGNEDSDIELEGGSDSDTINAGEGPDHLVSGGPGQDTISGGSGNETTMAGGDGGDTMYGNLGTDTVGGEAGGDRIEGNDDGDDLFDGYQAETVLGGAGSDVLYRCNDGVADTVSGVETLVGPSDVYR